MGKQVIFEKMLLRQKKSQSPDFDGQKVQMRIINFKIPLEKALLSDKLYYGILTFG